MENEVVDQTEQALRQYFVEPVEEAVEEAISPTKQEVLILALRAMADLYERNPELPTPDYSSAMLIYGVKKGELPMYARAFGSCDKVFDEYSYRLSKDFGAGIVLQTYSSREAVCERIKIGEEIVPAHVMPAQPATEEVFVEERVKEIFEWKCPGSILASTEGTSYGD